MDNNCIELLRKERHEFMNNLQIIYGYLQINKNDKALEYIKKVSKNNSILSELYNLRDNKFAYNLESKQPQSAIISKEKKI